MTTGSTKPLETHSDLVVGNPYIVCDNTCGHGFKIGDRVYYDGYSWFRDKRGDTWHLTPWNVKEDESMARSKKSVSAKSERNPKNFRNGDVIKVTSKHDNAMVFVKFGENYYNLSAGGQMKACRYLPPGTKEIVTNLSGMGKFFLMSEEELEEAARTERTEPDYSGIHRSVTDFEHIMKLADSYVQTDTTEEKG